MKYLNCKRCLHFLVFVAVFAFPTCWGITDPRDVYAINSLYAALNFPPLPGWIPIGGDPCGLGWQGVQCVNANITGIILNGANLGGQLSEDIGFFASIIQIDLGNNHIGGPMPSNLPLTIRSLRLSGNQFVGNIPNTISLLGQLTDLSLNDNHLTGFIPDAFQPLKGLTNIDLSGNSLNGPLPSSMQTLSSLTLLHLQNNQLTGTLDVLENLPLIIDLNVENNLFAGPIPDRLMTIPNFRKDGNPFNTTVLSSPPLPSPLQYPGPAGAPLPVLVPENQTTGPPAFQFPDDGTENNVKKSKNVTWIVVVGLLVVVALSLLVCLLMSQRCRRRQLDEKIEKGHERHVYNRPETNSKYDDSFQKPLHQAEKVTEETALARTPAGDVKNKRRENVAISSETKHLKNGKSKNASGEQDDHKIDMAGFDSGVLPEAVARAPAGDVKNKRRENVAISSETKHLKNGKSKNASREQDDHKIDMAGFDSGVLPEALARTPARDVKNKRRENVAISSETMHLKNGKSKNASREQEDDHKIDTAGFDSGVLPQAPPMPPFPLVSSVSSIADPILPAINPGNHAMRRVNSVKLFTVASLQQYTDSFCQENLVGKGLLGSVYKATLPDGKMLAVKKLDAVVSRRQSDEDFLELVSNLSKLQHPNIVKLLGYCMEHRQRVLVYDYCKNGTLHEALHFDPEIHRRLSWKTRVRMALQAAEALEYLHEVWQPPVVHKNFKSVNILLDDELTIRISDSGLAPLLSSDEMSQLQGCGYGAPELESGSYTHQSDVYSFGVVMLELLTGRKSYDRSRPRGEQILARWAIHQLHDIDALSRMVDPLLRERGACSSKSLSRFADIISLCIQPEPEFRPPMSEIVQNLLHMVQRDLRETKHTSP